MVVFEEVDVLLEEDKGFVGALVHLLQVRSRLKIGVHDGVKISMHDGWSEFVLSFTQLLCTKYHSTALY